MRRWMGGLAAALAVTAGSVRAEPGLALYHKPDAGTLVVSFSTADGREVGCLAERLDLNGSIEITSQPRRSENDFSEHYDSAAFVKGLNAAGYDNDQTDYYGKVEILKLPPGQYHFLSCSANYGVSYTPFPTGGPPPEIVFTIETGRATAIGGFRYVGLFGKGLFGARVVKYFAIQRVDSAERDLAIAKSVGVDVTNPIVVAPSTAAARSPVPEAARP